MECSMQIVQQYSKNYQGGDADGQNYCPHGTPVIESRECNGKSLTFGANSFLCLVSLLSIVGELSNSLHFVFLILI